MQPATCTLHTSILPTFLRSCSHSIRFVPGYFPGYPEMNYRVCSIASITNSLMLFSLQLTTLLLSTHSPG